MTEYQMFYSDEIPDHIDEEIQRVHRKLRSLITKNIANQNVVVYLNALLIFFTSQVMTFIDDNEMIEKFLSLTIENFKMNQTTQTMKRIRIFSNHAVTLNEFFLKRDIKLREKCKELSFLMSEPLNNLPGDEAIEVLSKSVASILSFVECEFKCEKGDLLNIFIQQLVESHEEFWELMGEKPQ